MSKSSPDNLEVLRERWKALYRTHLPTLAKERDPIQSRWPVVLDHCFARIVLDNAVGIDRPWTDIVKAPAVKHMSEQQLKDAINLAEQLTEGTANLDALNQRSLGLRGKSGPGGQKRKAESQIELKDSLKKSKMTDPTISKYFMPSLGSPKKQSGSAVDPAPPEPANLPESTSLPDMDVQILRIASSKLTPFRKQTLTLLCQIPRGRYSTYQAMSDHISRTSHKTCARAVGNAMRNNPFAPEVPCHRILAADGSLGGFGGSWGENGKFAGKKRDLLSEEGVNFDSKGKVKGPPFRDFYELEG